MNNTAIFGYAGQLMDSRMASYPLGNGYRHYIPGLMRFSAPDNRSPFGSGGLNPYSYCTADPINLYDPSGHSFLSGLITGLTFAGAAVGVVGGLAALIVAPEITIPLAIAAGVAVTAGLSAIGTGIASQLVKDPKEKDELGYAFSTLAFVSTVTGAGALGAALAGGAGAVGAGAEGAEDIAQVDRTAVSVSDDVWDWTQNTNADQATEGNRLMRSGSTTTATTVDHPYANSLRTSAARPAPPRWATIFARLVDWSNYANMAGGLAQGATVFFEPDARPKMPTYSATGDAGWINTALTSPYTLPRYSPYNTPEYNNPYSPYYHYYNSSM